MLLAVGAIVVAGRYLLRPVFRMIAGTRLRELFTATALLLVIAIALLMAKVGLSPALGTFVAGVVLANSEYRHELESEIDPFKGLLLAVFFIAVGASVDFQLIRSEPQLILGVVALLMVIKFAILFALGRSFRMGLDQNFLFAFALAQGGEFAFVLFSFATQNRVISEEITAPLIAAVAVTMALTPVLMLLNEKIVQPRFGTRESAEREADEIQTDSAVIIAGFGRFGSIVGRFLRANGIQPTVLEFDSDRVELLRKLGLQVYYGDASRKDLLEAAGAEHARLLVIAIEEHERALAIVETAQRHFPHLTILARAAGRPEAYELQDSGVEHVYRETLDTTVISDVPTPRRGIRARPREDAPRSQSLLLGGPGTHPIPGGAPPVRVGAAGRRAGRRLGHGEPARRIRGPVTPRPATRDRPSGVAIIGAGIAGISAGRRLVELGHGATLF